MKFYYSDSYKTVFHSKVNKFIPDDAEEITEQEYLDFINNL